MNLPIGDYLMMMSNYLISNYNSSLNRRINSDFFYYYKIKKILITQKLNYFSNTQIFFFFVKYREGNHHPGSHNTQKRNMIYLTIKCKYFLRIITSSVEMELI